MIFYESAMLTINYRLCKVEMKEQHNDFTKISLIFAEKLINARLQFVKDILIVILRNVIISFKRKKEDDYLDYSDINVIETAIEAIREEIKSLNEKMMFAKYIYLEISMIEAHIERDR